MDKTYSYIASQLATADVAIQSVQELLGHSDIRTTMRYSHLAPSKLKEAVEMIGIEKMGTSWARIWATLERW